MHAGKVDPGTESRAGQDCKLVSGIDAVDVERGIGFGISSRLRLGQDHVEVAAGLAHGSSGCSCRSR